MSSLASTFGVSEQHWNSLSDFDRELYARIRPLPRAASTVHNQIHRIEETLATMDSDAGMSNGRLELNPDFQRGHVWSQEKKVAFMEAVLRGTAPMTIRFNCPTWNGGGEEDVIDLNPSTIQCIDGLQRLTAMRDFVAGKFTIYGDLTVEKLKDTSFALNRMGAMWIMEMFQIKSRTELLQFYLDLNSGGVVHSAEELTRVQGLLAEAKSNASAPADVKPNKPKRTR